MTEVAVAILTFCLAATTFALMRMGQRVASLERAWQEHRDLEHGGMIPVAAPADDEGDEWPAEAVVHPGATLSVPGALTSGADWTLALALSDCDSCTQIRGRLAEVAEWAAGYELTVLDLVPNGSVPAGIKRVEVDPRALGGVPVPSMMLVDAHSTVQGCSTLGTAYEIQAFLHEAIHAGFGPHVEGHTHVPVGTSV